MGTFTEKLHREGKSFAQRHTAEPVGDRAGL